MHKENCGVEIVLLESPKDSLCRVSKYEEKWEGEAASEMNY
jgi:hypothetical protein